MKKPIVGIVGMGWVGKTYARVLRENPVCYSLERKYAKNKAAIAKCDFVLICVPTPATAATGMDVSAVESALALVGKGKTAIIKSTVVPGTTRKLARKFKHINIFHCPEFLSEKTAFADASTPDRLILGMVKRDSKNVRIAAKIEKLFPRAYKTIYCSAEEAEIAKFARNISGYVRIVTYNILYEAAKAAGADWKPIRNLISFDPLNGLAYTEIVHKGGRGAGGSCFIKDFEAFRVFYQKGVAKDALGAVMLATIADRNWQLLKDTRKDQKIVKAVYGDL